MLMESGVKVVMITGDAQPTAESIAERLGFFNRHSDSSMSGQEIDALTDNEMAADIQHVRVFYRTRSAASYSIV